MRAIALLVACLALAAPAAAQVTRVATVQDHSGTIASASTSQQAIPQSTTGQRGYLMCQNPLAATGPLLVDFGRTITATSGAIELAPGGTVTFNGLAVPMTSVNVWSATAGARFICKVGFN